MTSSIGEFLGAYKAPRLTCRITARADLLSEVTRTAAEYESLKVNSESLNGGPDARRLTERMEELTAQIRDSEMEFVFEALSKGEYDRLMSTCPPLPSQAKDGFGYNPDTFPEVLIAACAVTPEITVDEARALTDTLTESQFKKLWQTSLAVNIGDDAAPKFVMPSGLADPGRTSSVTPPSTESREASFGESSR